MKPATYIIIALAAVIAFLIWLLNRTQDKLNRTDSVLSEKTDSIRYFRSESGKIVAEKAAAEISLQDFRNHYSDLAAELKDVKVREKSLKAILKASMEAKGEGVVRIVRDTIRLNGGAVMQQDSLFVQDGYLDLRAALAFDENSSYRYTYSDSILFTLSTERKWLLGKRKLIGQVRMSNQNAKTLNQTAILIKQRYRRFNLSIGVSYLPFDNSFSPGINIGYSLFRF